VVGGKRHDHVRPNLELQVDLATAPAIEAPPFETLVLQPAAPFAAPTVENNLDIAVVSKPFDEIFVEAGIAARDEKQMSGHESLDNRSDVSGSSCPSH